MALKGIFNTMKKEGYVVKDLDQYLFTLNDSDSDRAINVNAPSQIGKCLRARYYSRMGYDADVGAIDPRTRRIFDNGTKTHERLQEYLLKMGLLLMDEIPVLSEEYDIQGHTDGLLKLSIREKAVLEIKSINSRQFGELKDCKEEHRKQGLSYVYCIEEHRKFLRERYANLVQFKKSEKERRDYYAQFYQHLKDGHKFTREQKIKFQVDLHIAMDKILFNTPDPITKVVFLYENKDTQELKEFCVSTTDPVSKEVLSEVLKDCLYLNECCEKGIIPDRCPGCTKSSQMARFCNFKLECFN
jgi:hypothetical protein